MITYTNVNFHLYAFLQICIMKMETKSERRVTPMKLKKLNRHISICKMESVDNVDLTRDFYFLGKTSRDITLVCNTSEAPENVLERSDGWSAFVIDEEMDLTMVGVMSELSGVLAKNHIGMFAASSYTTDYVLVKTIHFEEAMFALAQAGYEIVN